MPLWNTKRHYCWRNGEFDLRVKDDIGAMPTQTDLIYTA